MKQKTALMSLVALLSFAVLPSANAATTATVTLTATVQSAFSISVGSATAALSLTPGATPDTTTSTVTVVSNDGAGYNISVEADSANSDSSLYKSTAPTASIAADVPGNVTTNSNKWSLHVSAAPGSCGTCTTDEAFDGDGTTDEAVATSANRMAFNSSTTATQDWTVTYKAAVNGVLPAGAYLTTVTYTLASGVGS